MAETSLYFNNHQVGRIRWEPAGIQGQADVEYPRILIPLSIELDSGGGPYPKADLLFDAPVAFLSLADGKRVANALPARMTNLRKGCFTGSAVEHMLLEFPLDYRRIEKLDALRDGDLKLKVWLSIRVAAWGIPRQSDGMGLPVYQVLEVSHTNNDVWIDIPESHWRETVLPGLGYGRIQVIELAVCGLNSSATLGDSYAALKKAEQHLRRGLYDDAAAACRVALDQFIEYVDKLDEAGPVPVLKRVPRLKSSWETRLGVATYAWLEKCVSAIKGATNPVHHKATEHFDRFEAQMLFMITTALVSYAAQCAAGSDAD